MDHTHVGLRAVVRALSDVVAPAVHPGEAQARDQLRLSIEYLEFVLQRLDHLPTRDLIELRHGVALARELLALPGALSTSSNAMLAAALRSGEETLASGCSPPQTLRSATAALAAATSACVREAPALDPPARREIERCVLRASETRTAFERSWYCPLGLDPDPQDVRSLAETLSGLRD